MSGIVRIESGKHNCSMRRIALGCGMAFFLLASGLSNAQGRVYRDIRIPRGLPFTFPTAESKLAQMRVHQEKDGIRRHAWDIFSGLIQPSNGPKSIPIWETWYRRDGEVQLGCRHQSSAIERDLDIPQEIVAGFFASRKTVATAAGLLGGLGEPTEAILYNRAACRMVRQTKPDKQEADLDKTQAPAAERDIPSFPRNSIIVKAAWLPVPRNGNRQFPYWDGTKVTYTVVTQASKGEPCNLVPNKPNPYFVLTSCFYNVPISRRALDHIRKSGRWNDLDDDGVIVLVGLHVITKEVTDWTWSTFWWSTTPNDLIYSAQRPDTKFIPMPWRNYLMNATLSMETPWEENGTSPPVDSTCAIQSSFRDKICFNPYIEGEKGALSNCMTCHKQATYPRIQPDPSTNFARGYIGPGASCFENRIRVDYLWSLTGPAQDTQLSSFERDIQGLLLQLQIK